MEKESKGFGRHFEDDVVLRAAHAFEKMGIYA